MPSTEIITVDPNNIYEVAQTDKVTPFIPAGFHSVIKFAQLIHGSGMAPKDMKTPDQIAVAIFHGMEIGMTPMAALQSIAVINGRPSIWGDGALAMVRASGLLEDIKETYEGGELYEKMPEFDQFGKIIKAGVPNLKFMGVCTITRKGHAPVRHEFSVLDAMTAGLWNKEGPWKQHPKRMLKMRPRGFALRDEFTDIMRGLHLAEEVQDYDDMRDITPADKEPPTPDGDGDDSSVAAAKPRRGRPPRAAKEAAESASGAAAGTTIEHEAATGGADATSATKTTEKPAEAKAADEKPKAAAKAEAQDVAVGLPAIVPEFKSLDAKLRAYIIEMNEEMGKATTPDNLKPIWKKFWEKWTPISEDAAGKAAEDAVLKKVVAHHRARVEPKPAEEAKQEASGENPPDPGADEGNGFDYQAWLGELLAALEEAKTPEDVSAEFENRVEIPRRNNLITEAQIESDIRPKLLENMRRAEMEADAGG